MNDEIIIRDLSSVEPVPTSHHVGVKQVLLNNEDTVTDITQIAKSKLSAGEVASSHLHKDMEECFIFLSGRGWMTVDGVRHEIIPGRFFRIPCGQSHEVHATTNLDFITIGIEV